MKRAVSISIGSSKRDKTVEVQIFGETVCLERIGTDGDLKKAARLYRELDGKVDAFGVGGGLLGLMVGEHWYPMHSLLPLVAGVRQTPLVDGTGLKMTLEWRTVLQVSKQLAEYLPEKKALVMTAVDRWGMAQAAVDAGFDCVFGDLLYSLGMPYPIRSIGEAKNIAAAVAPVICRLPFHWVYPIGKSQEHRKPRFGQYFQQACLVLGDCHYIWKYMPDRMDGKVIITNTTTPEDVEAFRSSGARFLVTTTPVYDGRSFGTNMMEAAIVAACGRTEPVNYGSANGYFHWMNEKLDQLNLPLQIQELYQ
jgi:hypothetical protein